MISEIALPEFLQNFSPISLHYRKPESDEYPWVFWSESEGSENNSTSADLGTPIIHDKIKSVLSDIERYWWCLAQFWAPVTIDGRRLLSTSAQPFAVCHLSNKFAKYRLNSEKYKYNIDAHKLDIEPDHMIKSGGPATAFLNCRTSMSDLQWFLSESYDYGGLNYSVMVPICFPHQSNCIGVLEFTLDNSKGRLAYLIDDTVKAIKDAGLDVFYVQDLIPYKTINGLKLAKDHIEEALKVVCESHKLALAQVWIAYKDKSNVPFSYTLGDTQTEQVLAIKLTGYCSAIEDDGCFLVKIYFRSGDVTPRAIGEKFPLVTLQDYESRYIPELHSDTFISWTLDDLRPTSGLAICLRSNDTGDYNYVFEFIWIKESNYVINIYLDNILLTLKRCLPRFKFASGVEIGNELHVHIEGDEPKKFKIFQGKKSMVVDYIAHSEVKCKTTPKVLPREVIEKQFGKTMKDAAKNVNVSLSTFKRKFKELGIPEWPGPNFVKRNINGSSIIQFNTIEEDSGAIEETSTVNLNKNVMTVKAEYEDDIIKFHLPISEATIVNIEKEIGMKLKLSDKTYKLKYRDEDGDWITITSDDEMADCIKSSRKSDRIVVRMRVLPSQLPISGWNLFWN